MKHNQQGDAMAALKILLIEDDVEQAELLADFLGGRNYQVTVCHEGEPALAVDEAPHFILLDLNLPDIEGVELCPRLRTHFPSAFIIMLTARSDEVDRIVGLEVGADDYVTKPYSLREVEARIRAIWRRRAPVGEPGTGLQLSEAECSVSLGNKSLELTTREYKLLETLSKKPGRIFSREQLIDICWDDLYVSDRSVDAMVARLRKKLSDSFGKKYIATKHGLGYVFQDS